MRGANVRPEIIRTEGVTKRFGGVVAVNNIDYVLYENEIAGILGSNGAGKSVFFNLLTGYYRPDEGSIRYQGADVTRLNPQERVARGMTRTFQLTSAFDNLTVVDNLVLSLFRAQAKPSLLRLFLTSRKGCREEAKIAETLDTFDLDDVRDREVKTLSLGEKRRLEIAMAVLVEPKVLLLDEPLAGLAESEIQRVLDALRRRVGRLTILIVEHKLTHVQDFLERIIVMHEGRVIAEGGCEECLRHPEVRRSYWQIEVPADEREAAVS